MFSIDIAAYRNRPRGLYIYIMLVDLIYTMQQQATRLAENGSAAQVHLELFRRTIEGNENKLVREIEVESGIWTELQARFVLTEQQLQLCQSEVF